MKTPRIHLTIDRLVLNGVQPGERGGVEAALVAELHRLLATPGGTGALGAGRHVAAVRANPVRTGSSLGVEAARGIAQALKP